MTAATTIAVSFHRTWSAPSRGHSAPGCQPLADNMIDASYAHLE